VSAVISIPRHRFLAARPAAIARAPVVGEVLEGYEVRLPTLGAERRDRRLADPGTVNAVSRLRAECSATPDCIDCCMVSFVEMCHVLILT
jgi:hypothetical protein